jgi:hypothetical protein
MLKDKFHGAMNGPGVQSFQEKLAQGLVKPEVMQMTPGQTPEIGGPAAAPPPAGNPVEPMGMKALGAPDAPAAPAQTFKDFASKAGKGWDLQAVKNAYLKRQGRLK